MVYLGEIGIRIFKIDKKCTEGIKNIFIGNFELKPFYRFTIVTILKIKRIQYITYNYHTILL